MSLKTCFVAENEEESMLFDQADYRTKPLYISDFQKRLAQLPSDETQRMILHLVLNEAGEYRKLAFVLPNEARMAQERELCKRYVLAMMNNMIVSFGGLRLELFYDRRNALLDAICHEAIEAFDLKAEQNNRKGYGVYINYISRMNQCLGLAAFQMCCKDLADWKEPDKKKLACLSRPGDKTAEIVLLRRSAQELEGKCFCSLDIGGNSIKAALVCDGEIVVLQEQQWYPTACMYAHEMLEPIELMLKFLRGCVSRKDDRAKDTCLPAGDRAASLTTAELRRVLAEMEETAPQRETRVFDAIVIGFPDIVVNNKIAGGESFKHQGMKMNALVDYETEFQKTVSLDDLARPYAKKDAPIIVLNDGNAASFLSSVEQAFAQESWIDENGLFANTIGTEMGTGFISREGSLHYFPLEDFQHIIDLGSSDYAQYPAWDIRSTNSMNTGIPGTVQKTVTQLGLFRLAVLGLMEKDPPQFEQLLAEGLLTYDAEGRGIYVHVKPVDRRAELTRRLLDLLDEGHPVLQELLFEMGKAYGVLIDQDRLIFPEIGTTRLLSGGIVARDAAYKRLCAGLAAHNPSYCAMRLDGELYSPLLKKMRPEERNFSVAIGSTYIGNRFILERERGNEVYK